MQVARILIITSRNVVTTGGEFSLIFNRADALKQHWGVVSDIVALKNIAFGVKSGEEAFGSGEYIEASFKNPVSLLGGYEKVIKAAENKLATGKYDAILVSGVGLLRYVDRIRKSARGALLCADVHGYYGDGKLLAKDESPFLGAFHRLASSVEEWEQKTFLKQFDRIFTVSSEYVTFLCQNAGCREQQFYVVPCAINEGVDLLSSTERDYNRGSYRTKYGIEDTDLLLVYSGGVSSWQCLPQTITLVNRMNELRPTKLLILSGDKEGARRVVDGCESAASILIDGYPPSLLPNVFCAADFCVMLRDDVPTNHFAYPNKFLEYVSANRPVITTPYVLDVAKQINQFGVGLIYDNDVVALNRSIAAFDFDNARYQDLLALTSFKQTLKPFVTDLTLA